jgi:hypothetical protein
MSESSGFGGAIPDVRPRVERTCPGGAVLVGGDVVAAELKEVVDQVLSALAPEKPGLASRGRRGKAPDGAETVGTRDKVRRLRFGRGD